jgi:hypothetical protein
MLRKINGRLIFVYTSPKKEYKKLIKADFKLSLLAALIGIFLLPQAAHPSAITPEKLIELTNQERAVMGLSPLTANQLLTEAAIQKGKTILETSAFKHTINDRKFSAWIRDTGYNYSYVGENLAMDFTTSEAIMAAWNDSLPHKKNLLSPYYQEIGIAALPGKFQGQDTTVVVQTFGSPATGSATPWAESPGFGRLNSNLIPGEVNLFSRQFVNPENLLTHVLTNQEISPLYDNKLTLPVFNYQNAPLNKFIAQPNYQTVFNNLTITLVLITFVYLLIFLYYYYFSKVNRLVSV